MKNMKNMTRNLQSVLGFLVPRMWRIEGTERTTVDRLAIIWCGPEKQQEYMANRIFGVGNFNKKCIGRRPVMLLDQLQESFNCSLAVVAGPQQILSWMRRNEDIFVPWWVDAELDLDNALEPIGRSRSLKEDLRRARKNALAFEFAKTADDYEHFYEKIYMPTITASHGAATLPSSFEKRCAEIESGRAEIMFITMNKKRIGGLLLDYRKEVPALRDIGIIGGDKKVLKTGVITAANYFAMQYLKEKGVNRICLGLSRCFLNDGVLTFKQKWKPTLIESSPESFMFRVSRLCDASRSFLRSSSFIAEQEGEFHFAFFAANDDDVRANRSKLTRLSTIYGIDAHSNIDVSGQRPKTRRAS